MAAKLTRAIATDRPVRYVVKHASEVKVGDPYHFACVDHDEALEIARDASSDPDPGIGPYPPGWANALPWVVVPARPGPAPQPPTPLPSVSYTLTCTSCRVAHVKVRVETSHDLDRREVPRFVRAIAIAQSWDCSARFVAGQSVEQDLCPTCREVR